MIEQHAGQVWRWTIGDPDSGLYSDIDEMYLLLWPEPMGQEWAMVSGDSSHMMWSALNLETGSIEFVTPEYTAGIWELME